MKLAPINLPGLFSAVLWPVLAIVAVIVFRKTLADLLIILGQRIDKLSFAGMTFELAKATELKAPSIETDIRELEAGTRPQSDSVDLLAQLRDGGSFDYIVIDLGSDTHPRWLTSRLYLFGLILARVGRLRCFVFVETLAGVRSRFVGAASPDAVRWAFACHYPWLEHAFSRAYAKLGFLYFDAKSKWLVDWQVTQLMQLFLSDIRLSTSAPSADPLTFIDPNKIPESIDLGNGVFEYAKWVDGGRIEQILGADMSKSSVTIPAGGSLADVSAAALECTGRFLAIVEPDHTFRGLIDRSESLERLASEFSKQSR